MPGSVYQIVRARLAGEAPPNRDAANKVLRALAASVVLASLYLIALGPRLIGVFEGSRDASRDWIAKNPRATGLLALFLLFIVPATCAVIAARRWYIGERIAEFRGRGFLDEEGRTGAWAPIRAINATLAWLARRSTMRGGLRFDPTPTAWDWAVDHAVDGLGFVRVLGKDNQWKGGAFSGGSYFTTYPEPPAVFVEQAWQLDGPGTIRGGAGRLSRCVDSM